jgi:hypothetical protein
MRPLVFCAEAKTARNTAKDRVFATRRAQGEWKKRVQVRSAIGGPPREAGFLIAIQPAEIAFQKFEEGIKQRRRYT